MSCIETLLAVLTGYMLYHWSHHGVPTIGKIKGHFVSRPSVPPPPGDPPPKGSYDPDALDKVNMAILAENDPDFWRYN